MATEQNWVIIGKPHCPWCDKAKLLLTQACVDFSYLDIQLQPALRMFLLDSGLRTVPQVFRSGHLIGGFEELQEYLKKSDNKSEEQLELFPEDHASHRW